MRYFTIPPPAALKDYVRFFWVLESDGGPYVHRSMADGCPELIFHYDGIFDELKTTGKSERSFKAGLHGQSQSYSRFGINRPFGIFGAYLFPYALPVLFQLPASDCSNQMIDLHALPGMAGTFLEEQLFAAASNTERVQLLSAFLEKRLMQSKNKTHDLFSAVQLIIKSNGLLRVEDVAAQSGYSGRQLERHFKTFSGFTPKLFSRITRFQTALREYGQHHKSLTEIAYDCGYYDQSHFIHDFKTFSGHHPKKYFSDNAEGTAWKN